MTLEFEGLGFKDKIPTGITGEIRLLSITIPPTGSFDSGNKYYNSTNKLIYTAVTDNTWDGAIASIPLSNIFYTFDNEGTIEYYQWDGENLVEVSIGAFQLKANMSQDYNDNDPTKYPSSKALSDGLTTKQGVLTAGPGITIENNVISAANSTKINNYTGAEIDNFVLSVTSGDQKYFTPKDNITDIFTADKWKIKFTYKYLGKHNTFPRSAGVVACMGVAGGNGTPTAKGFLITDSAGGFSLRLSSDGETWDIFDDSVAIPPNGYNPNAVYSFILEFTGTGYYLYCRGAGEYVLLKYVSSSTKISCGSDNSSATIIFGTGIDDEDSCDHYQTFADWYLKDCYIRLGNIQYDFTVQWHNPYKPDVIETGDYDEMEIKGHSIYKTVLTNSIANEITINSCENSNEETYIELVVDDNPNSLSFIDNSGITWVDGQPMLQAGKTYQIVIVNKVGYYREI